MAEGCLDFLPYVCDEALLSSIILKGFPFALYVAEYWWQHLSAANDGCSPPALDLARDLLIGSSVRSLRWLQIYNIDMEWRDPDFSLVAGDLPAPIYYAARIGISGLFFRTLSANVDVNAQGGYYGNALQEASVYSHEEVVRLLFDEGADVNAHGGKYGNALQAAWKVGHEQVVLLLLGAGADVNAQGGRHGNALYVAWEDGHAIVVYILIDVGAYVTARGVGLQ